MTRTLDDWLALQQSVHARSIDLGLERVAPVAERLALRRPPYRVVTVAGTNGKGSTVAHLEAMLRTGGIDVGAFTSPHLTRYHERVSIRGALATDADLVAAFEAIEAARATTTLTYFEYGTLAALWLFARERIEVAVLEVGLGGRLDATNLIDADVAVLTSVGLDHRDWLGDSLESIGAEKVGIVRAGRPAILATADMPESVYQGIASREAHAVVAGRDYHYEIGERDWRYRSARRALDHLPPPALPGQVQYVNAAAAVAALEWLDPRYRFDAETIGAALRAVELPGRLQILEKRPQWILDVAHNPPAARVLASELDARPIPGRTFAIVGILADKDAAGIVRELEGRVDRWIACALPGPRGRSGEDLASVLGDTARAVACEESVEAGCARALAEADADDRIVVFGSFLTVGPALEWLRLY